MQQIHILFQLFKQKQLQNILIISISTFLQSLSAHKEGLKLNYDGKNKQIKWLGESGHRHHKVINLKTENWEEDKVEYKQQNLRLVQALNCLHCKGTSRKKKRY